MKSSKISVGVAGCGHLGSIHCKLLNAICSGNPQINFVGVYDIDKSRSEGIAASYKITSFDTLEQMLSEINSLIIVSTTSAHYEIAKSALQKEINLFIEKPVTSSLKEAEKLIEISESKQVKIQIGHVERFNPALVALEKYDLKTMFIESHRLAQFNPRGTDVSVIQDLMIHDIDIILSLVKSPIQKIDANGVPILSDTIDIANARLQFENGCAANVTASRISLKKMRKMRIFQQNAYISIDFLNNKPEIFRLADISVIPKSGLSYPVSADKHIIFEQPEIDLNNTNPIKNELESFFKSILDDKPVKVSLEEAKEAVEVADSIINIIANTKKQFDRPKEEK
jgi:predicted dehydrogenase